MSFSFHPWLVAGFAPGVFLVLIVSLASLSIAGIVFLRRRSNRRKNLEMGAGERGAAPGSKKLNHNLTEEKAKTAEIRMGLLPIERKGSRLHIAAGEIFCVRANAHYTYLFNGYDDLFCPLSISEIDARLPKQNFFRTHRSHIVNLAHVSGVKKVADAGIAELDSPRRRTAPISRDRVAALRQELAAFRAGAAIRPG